MKRSEMIEGLKDGIRDHNLDPREDLYLYIQEAIKELEGTRSIEEVLHERSKLDYFVDSPAVTEGYRWCNWFLTEDE